MKKFIIIVCLAAAGFILWQYGFGSGRTYEANAMESYRVRDKFLGVIPFTIGTHKRWVVIAEEIGGDVRYRQRFAFDFREGERPVPGQRFRIAWFKARMLD